MAYRRGRGRRRGGRRYGRKTKVRKYYTMSRGGIRL